jgi:succinate dehydrogenase flavin-adding protein (antitoxin of CptAB toxin-antitoxin module)
MKLIMTNKRFLSTLQDSYRKQLLYRSKQRGLLEVDVILGSWAYDNIPKLNKNALLKYEKILNQDTTDIFDVIIGSKSIPQELDKDLIKSIQEYSHTIDFSTLKKKLPN